MWAIEAIETYIEFYLSNISKSLFIVEVLKKKSNIITIRNLNALYLAKFFRSFHIFMGVIYSVKFLMTLAYSS